MIIININPLEKAARGSGRQVNFLFGFRGVFWKIVILKQDLWSVLYVTQNINEIELVIIHMYIQFYKGSYLG